jgi:hypothetical protein
MSSAIFLNRSLEVELLCGTYYLTTIVSHFSGTRVFLAEYGRYPMPQTLPHKCLYKRKLYLLGELMRMFCPFLLT